MDGGEDNSREQNVSKRRQKPSDPLAEDEAPKAKRQRVSRACDQCRLSRDKCDGKSPCHTCVANGRDCSYTTSPKKRGIQPGYIRTLELSLALLINRDFEAEKHLLSQLSSHRSSLRQSVSLKDTTQPDDLFSKWTNSGVCKQIDTLLSGSLEADLPVPDITPQSGPVARIWPSDAPSEVLSGAILQLPTEFWSLLDHYYTYTHNWLPVSEKNEILKTAYSYPIDESNLHSSGDLGRHAELWAIIALTCQQRLGSTAANAAAAATARRLIPHKTSTLDTGHVRALLLLALSSHAKGDKLGSWMDVGTAIRILTYHMKLTSDDPRLPYLTLACHVVECIISAQLDIDPHLAKQTLSQVARVQEDGLEEWSPWQPLAGDEGSNVRKTPHSRQPGRCMSTFNSLANICGTLCARTGDRRDRDDDDRHAIGSAWRNPVSSNAPGTPQQLHLDTIAAWAHYKNRSLSRADFEQTLSYNLLQFRHCGGLGAIPPTLIPIVDSFVSSGKAAIPDTYVSTASEVLRLWSDSSSSRRSQAYASRTSDASYSRQPGAITVPQDAPQPDLMSYPADLSDPAPHPIQSWVNNIPKYPIQNAPLDNTSIPMASMNQDTPSGISDGALNPDFEAIFEEMAQLDGTRHANDGSQQFMQNLGLGPDSDLRAFFGADYQESDPLLAYIQFDRPPQPGATDSSNYPR
ncbi:hypothetical protein K461DRAFT_289526 [Myriangium duriaei CBS 260.36]|uniref:Zn(2)-C6 fungal-type domain-containing protein n=1 Tax=Myriangium duriaei CBS 260.36 TaxID=1168546 RepID=A0A9P4MPF2_9PEZI|nr:hypothetical protein K461DRAFT_289526 [Myriangium duriaei CBS 260.36]